jgi:hypothetical protein
VAVVALVGSCGFYEEAFAVLCLCCGWGPRLAVSHAFRFAFATFRSKSFP